MHSANTFGECHAKHSIQIQNSWSHPFPRFAVGLRAGVASVWIRAAAAAATTATAGAAATNTRAGRSVDEHGQTVRAARRAPGAGVTNRRYNTRLQSRIQS